MNLRTTLLVILVLPSSIATYAQTPEQDAYTVVEHFFDALQTADTTLMASILLEDGQAHAVMPTDSTTNIRLATHAQTLAMMPRWTTPVIERMWDPTILVNGPLAVVWGSYDLYVGEEFSHCGVDAFTLIQTDAGWKISNVDYTIERGTCELHPDGPPDFSSASDG